MRRKLRQRVAVPKLREKDSWDLAVYLAKKYNSAKSVRAKRDVLETMLYLAPYWDRITRSICYYNIFEEYTETNFPVFWGVVDYSQVVTWLNNWESKLTKLPKWSGSGE